MTKPDTKLSVERCERLAALGPQARHGGGVAADRRVHANGAEQAIVGVAACDGGLAMTRILITGGPRTGKTTLAAQLCDAHETCRGLACPRIDGALRDGKRCGEPRHTDDLIEQTKHLGKDAWSAASLIASGWLDEPGPWIIEGVAASRALRKWRDQHPEEPPPVDRVIYLSEPHQPLAKGQETMAKGVRTVHDEIEPWLRKHGVQTEYQ